MPISYYFILSILDVGAVSFKSSQKKKSKKKKERYFLKEKKSRPHLTSKASFLIYLTIGLNLKSQISNKIVWFFFFFGISFWAANKDIK